MQTNEEPVAGRDWIPGGWWARSGENTGLRFEAARKEMRTSRGEEEGRSWPTGRGGSTWSVSAGSGGRTAMVGEMQIWRRRLPWGESEGCWTLTMPVRQESRDWPEITKKKHFRFETMRRRTKEQWEFGEVGADGGRELSWKHCQAFKLVITSLGRSRNVNIKKVKHWTNWVRWHILIRSCATSQSCEYRETVSSAFQNVKSSAFCYLPPGSYYYSCHNSDRPGIKNWPSDDWTMHVRGLDIRLVGCRNQPLRENSGDEWWAWICLKCKKPEKANDGKDPDGGDSWQDDKVGDEGAEEQVISLNKWTELNGY